jgi:hypothetical protein
MSELGRKTLYQNSCSISFVFGKKYSSRKVQQNCAISFWFHQYLVLHAFADILMWREIFFLHSKILGRIEELNKGFLFLSLCPNEEGMMEGTYDVQKV